MGQRLPECGEHGEIQASAALCSAVLGDQE
jgi:hypothetical protein